MTCQFKIANQAGAVSILICPSQRNRVRLGRRPVIPLVMLGGLVEVWGKDLCARGALLKPDLVPVSDNKVAFWPVQHFAPAGAGVLVAMDAP